MDTITLIIGILIVLLIAGIIVVFSRDENKPFISYLVALLIMSSVCLGGIIDDFYVNNTIPAIEVYRGNTELQITNTVVNDSIVKCDSIVTLKNYDNRTAK